MAAQDLHQELAEIFAALHVHSLEAFEFRGNAHVAAMPATPARPNGDAYAPLRDTLRNVLYGGCYTRSTAPDFPPATTPQAWLAQLMSANSTQDRWDPAWSIYQQGGDGRLLVQKGERSRAAVIGEYATNKPPGVPPQVGDQVSLRVCPGSSDMQQGFYFAFGATLSDQFDDYSLLRFYFNLQAEGAAEWLRAVSSRFNHYAVPFRYKTLADPCAYTRADAAVLYVAKRYYAIAAALVAAIAEPLQACLRPETPMFCHALRPGIGLAEEPGTGESFGMHRCRLVAEGVIDAWLAGSQAVDARLEAVRQRFAANGIRLDAPYLNAQSMDLFRNEIFAGGITL